MRRRHGADRAAAVTSVPLPAAGTLVSVEAEHLPAVTSRVEAVEGWRVTVVAPTRAGGRPVEIGLGTPVKFGWGAATGWWQASATLTGHGQDVVALWELTTARVERWQRRDAFRLEVAVPVELRHGGGGVATTTLDLSELGLGCRVPTRLAPRRDEQVTVELQLLGEHDEPSGALPARVVRADPSGGGEVELGLAFEALDPEVRERLRRFVFDMQLGRRREG